MQNETFYSRVLNLGGDRDLEEYLLAMYGLVLERRLEKPTEELMFGIIRDAFSASPFPFQEQWLEIVECPEINELTDKFLPPNIRDEAAIGMIADVDGLVYSLAVLRFQISELHKMRGKQLEEEYRYFGIDSETGHRWYNFDPIGNLEGGMRCFGMDQEEDETESDEEDGEEDWELSWAFLGDLMEAGRVYE